MIITSSMLGIFMEPSARILLGFINSRLRNCARPYLDILASHLSCGSRRLGVNHFKHPICALSCGSISSKIAGDPTIFADWTPILALNIPVFAGFCWFFQPLLPWRRGDGSAKPGEVSVEEGLGAGLAGLAWLGGGGQVQAFTFCARWLKRNAQTWPYQQHDGNFHSKLELWPAIDGGLKLQ